jgi:DNA-binding CsgD family transcriptional regulator
MSIWDHFLRLIGLHPDSDPRTYQLSESMHVTLATIAQHEGRPEHELTTDLLAAGLTQYYSTDELMPKWESLSPREKDVVALVCLGYTSRQIAARLGISAETVKTRVKNALIKFNLHSRNELRILLNKWDFSAWETQM